MYCSSRVVALCIIVIIYSASVVCVFISLEMCDIFDGNDAKNERKSVCYEIWISIIKCYK